MAYIGKQPVIGNFQKCDAISVVNGQAAYTLQVGGSNVSPQIDEDKYNIWNSSSWWFGVETGQLVMFPSSTTHQVDTKKGNNTRVSLAFNTFYKGTIGSNSNLTELIL